MALGILEDKNYGQHVSGFSLECDSVTDNPSVWNKVPGTSLLKERKSNTVAGILSTKLKHSDGVVLIPQPSDDGKDPLNWPRWKKECHYWSLCLAAGLAGAIGHLLNVGFKDIAAEWGVSVDAVAATNADLSMALGWFTLFQGSLAIKFGRRPVFLFASTCQFFTCIWAAKSANINSFKAARVFQGFGMAPYEALAAASIGDVFFVHERGKRVAIWNFAIGGGLAVTPIINGIIINRPDLGWRWTFWIIMIVFGTSLLTSIFLMPETMYDREIVHGTDSGVVLEDTVEPNSIVSGMDNEQAISPEAEAEKIRIGYKREESSSLSETSSALQLSAFTSPPKTFLQELKPWSYISNVSVVKSIFRPMLFLLSPAVWFTFFSYGCTTVWLVVVSVIYSLVFGSAPYFFDATKVGLVSIGPFIGSIIGTVIAGPLSDWSVKWAAGRNKGVYEPEFRLFLLVPMFVLDIVGYIGWAVMQPKGLPWIGPVVMYSMISAGQCIGATAVCAYLIDVHRENAPECFALVNFMKNMVLYGFTLFVNGWVVELGVLSTFGILAGVTAFCILTGIPMYIFGKRARAWVARHPKLFFTNRGPIRVG